MPQKLRIATLLNFALLVFWGNCANAHEFWVAPKEFTVQLGDVINASLLVGQSMQGKDYPYLSYKFQSLQVASPSGISKTCKV